MNSRSFHQYHTMGHQEGCAGEGLGNAFGGPYAGDSEGGMPGGMEQRLYSRLLSDGRYSDLDKAKHNPQYRSYLLENYDDDMPF